MEGVTRFGSVASPVSAAATVLRARAASAGLELGPVDDADLAAAVVGADAWALLCRTDSLDRPGRFGEPSVRALAAILSRCAGLAGPLFAPDLSECSLDPSLLAAAEGHVRMAADLCGAEMSASVLARAASDLSAAGPGTAFSAYAALLLHVA